MMRTESEEPELTAREGNIIEQIKQFISKEQKE